MDIHLNLLPDDRKKEIAKKKRFKLIIRREILYLVPILAFFIMLVNIYVLLGIQEKSSEQEIKQQEMQDKYKELAAYEKKFSQVNDSTAQILKLEKAHMHWSRFFSTISSVAPEGISLSEVSTKDFQIFLVGKAKTRDNLLSFKDALEKNSCFAEVNVPLSNMVNKDDIVFQIDFRVQDNCIK